MLRGSILRSTEFAIGIVIYVGKETKINLNSVKSERKRSWLLNSMHYAASTLLCSFLVVVALVTFAGVYFNNSKNITYLKADEKEIVGQEHKSPKEIITESFWLLI